MNPQWGHLNGSLPIACPTGELNVHESKFGDDDDDGSEPTGAEKLNMLVNDDGDGDGNEGDDRLTKKSTIFPKLKEQVAKQSSIMDENWGNKISRRFRFSESSSVIVATLVSGFCRVRSVSWSTTMSAFSRHSLNNCCIVVKGMQGKASARLPKAMHVEGFL